MVFFFFFFCFYENFDFLAFSSRKIERHVDQSSTSVSIVRVLRSPMKASNGKISFQKGRKFTLEERKDQSLSLSLSREQRSFGSLDYFRTIYFNCCILDSLERRGWRMGFSLRREHIRPMTNRILCFRWADPVGGLSKIRARGHRRNEAVSFGEVLLVVRGSELFRAWPQARPGVQEQKHGSSRGQIQVLEMLEIVSLEAPFDGARKGIVRPEEGRVLPIL